MIKYPFVFQIGRFFGEIDPSLMRHLVNISVYAFNKSYDYQSVCDPGAAPKQGAGHRSAYVVSKACGWASGSSHGENHASVDQCNEFLIFILHYIAIDCRHTADWLVGHGCCLVSQVFGFIINERKRSLKYGFVTREWYYGYYSFLWTG